MKTLKTCILFPAIFFATLLFGGVSLYPGDNASYFRVMSPGTSAYLSYDEKNFYIAFHCQEPEIDSVEKGRLWYEGVEVFLLPVSGGKNFQIGLTPDGTSQAFWGGEQLGGETGIELATFIGEDYWTAEISVPFSLMDTHPSLEASVWRICLTRSRMSAFNSWPMLSGSSGYHDFRYFAELIFNPEDEALLTAGPGDRKIGVRPAEGRIEIDGVIGDSWLEASLVTDFVVLPPTGDRRLQSVPPFEEIRELLGGRYKDRGYTLTLSREDVDRARRLIAQEEWAQLAFAGLKNIADYWAGKSDIELYNIIPDSGPMAWSACYSFGCPVCGVGQAGNTASALRTSIDSPGMWQCVTCERWYGDGQEIEYSGKKFIIEDDGSGWHIPEGLPGAGHTCYFEGAWKNYLLSNIIGSHTAFPLHLRGRYIPFGAISSLASVYAVTGEPAYAHKALLILTRLAQLHPAYDGLIDIGGSEIMPHIGWNSSEVVSACARSYDIVFEQLSGADELVNFFREQGHSDIDGDGILTYNDIRKSIAVNLFGYMYDWLLRVRAYSRNDDWTINQSAQIVEIGRLLDNPHIVYEAFYGEKGFHDLVIQRYLNDGRLFYNSLAYNFGQPAEYYNVLASAYGYHDGEVFEQPLDFFDDSQLPFSHSVHYAINTMCAGRIPGIGDAVVLRRRRGPDNSRLIAGMSLIALRYPWIVEKIHDREVLTDFVKSRVARTMPHNILELISTIPYLEEVLSGAESYSPQRTHLFTDSGLAILRTEDDGFSQVHALLNYGIDGRAHSHHDHLALNIIAHGYELTINKGYPYTWIPNAKVPGWTKNSAAQNVVRIDGVNQTAHDLLSVPVESCAGRLHAFADNSLAAMAEGSNEHVYPGLADTYRRGVVLVKDPLTPFVVDIHNVAGGSVRDYQFHAQSDTRGENFAITLDDGTELAAAEEPVRYIDRRFMYDISRADIAGGDIKARWWIGDKEDTGLVFHMMGTDAGRTVITGRGQAEGDDNPLPCDMHLTVREEGDGPSCFVSILFPYTGSIPVYSASMLKTTSLPEGDYRPFALRVTTAGNSYIIFHDLEGRDTCLFSDGDHTYTFNGKLGVILERDGEVVSASLSAGTAIGRDKDILQAPAGKTGKVTGVDNHTKSVVLSGMGGELGEGTLIRWLDRPWVYRVTGTEDAPGGTRVYLDTFSLLDKGTYTMIEEGDRVEVLNNVYGVKTEKGTWQISGSPFPAD